MNNFESYSPTKVIFGKRAEEEVGKEVQDRGFRKVLIHLGGIHLYENGTLDRVHKSLSDCGIGYVDSGGMALNPRLGLVEEGIQLCRKEGIDFILTIGGGSPIDSTKGIAYGLVNDFDVEDLLMGRFTTNRIAPLGCISTIVAMGPETSNSMVIITEERMLKCSYNHDCVRPFFAIMNPELTYTLPPYQTASGAIDIMMHTMGHYFTNTEHVELIDRMAESLLVSVREAALLAIKGPDNYNTRADLMWAGSLSHNGLTGIGRVSDFASHKIEREMGGMFGVAHGAGLCAIWGGWARYVYKANPARFVQFAINVFGVPMDFHDLEGTALKGVKAQEDWRHRLGMPTSTTELGIQPTEGQIEEMAEKCAATGGGYVGFFKILYRDDVMNTYHMAEQISSQS